MRKNTLALNETADSPDCHTYRSILGLALQYHNCILLFSDRAAVFFGKFSEPASGYTGACLGFSNTILLNDRILSVYLYNADAKQIASDGENFSIDTSVLNTDA